MALAQTFHDQPLRRGVVRLSTSGWRTRLRWMLVVAFAAELIISELVPSRWTAPLQIDHAACNVAYLLAAGAALLRSRSNRRERHAWRLVSLAMACYLLGNVWFVYGPTASGPSPADAAWLSCYALALTAIVVLTIARLRTKSSAWLDGSIAGFGAGAVAAAFVFRQVADVSTLPFLAALVNLAYPVADLTLVVLLVVIGHGVRGKDRSWLLLAVGFTAFFVGDLICLYQTAAGAWNPFGPWEPVWPLGATFIGLAACSPSAIRVPKWSPPSFVVPAAFTVAAIGLLIAGRWMELPAAAVGLAIATLVLAGLRGAKTVREIRTVATGHADVRIDHLTQLPNRRRLLEHLASELLNLDRSIAILVLDLDRFKEINDSLGHAVGDRLLARVGNRLDKVKPAGSLLARLGGDEFALVLPSHDERAACGAAWTMQEALRRPFALAGLRVTVQASIGVAASAEHGRSAAELLRTADIAMYQAKQQGAGVATYRVDDQNPSRPRLKRIAELRQALGSGQFVLWYQPQWDAALNEATGVEALVRWRHPDDGVLTPDAFLPLLAQFGMMTELADIVLRQAVAAWAQLRDLGHSLRMSVNVSAADLAGPRLAPTFRDLTERFDVPAGALTIEVTEDDVIKDHVKSVSTLGELRRAGATISVDDYGTGRASLMYLRDLPLDELKLDRTFLRGTPEDAHNAAIVRSTIELAHALQLNVVAEGVEDGPALAWLRGLNCDLCQGYHIARPMPFDALVEWLDRRPIGAAIATATN